MSYNQAVQLLREFGFPIVVAIWFMFRLEKRLDRLFTLLNALLQTMMLLAKSVDYHFSSNNNQKAQAVAITPEPPVLEDKKQ